MSQNLQRLCTV